MPNLRRQQGVKRRGSNRLPAPFSPTDIDGAVLALDAAKGVVLSGSDVSTWADQSDAGNDASAGAAAPSYNATDADFNDHPSVEFVAASTETLDCTGLGTELAGEDVAHHVFIVGKLSSTATIQSFLGAGDATASDYYRWGFTTAGVAWAMQKWDGVATVSGSQGGADTDAHILEFSSPGTTADVYEDGAGTAGQAFNNGSVDTTAGVIGARLSAGTRSQYLDGKIAYLIVYNRKLDAGERTQVLEFLQDKYGTPALP